LIAAETNSTGKNEPLLRSLRRLLPYLGRYRGRYLLGSICVIAAVVLRFLVPSLLGDTIDELRHTQAADLADVRRQVTFGAIGIVVAAALGALVRTTSRLMILGNSRLAIQDVREDLFGRLVRLAPSFYVRHRTGQIMSRCVNDMQNVQGLLGPVFLYLVETAVLYGVGTWFLVSANGELAILGLLPFPLFLVAAHRLARRVQVGTRRAQERLGEVSAKVDESLTGHRVIKSLGIEAHDRARFEELAGGYADTQVMVGKVRASLTALMTFLAALCTFSVLAFGAPRVDTGQLTLGALVSVVLYLNMLAAPTRTLGFVLSSLQRGAAALGRIGEYLDLEPSISDSTEPVRAALGPGGIHVSNLRVELEGVDSTSPEDARSALHGVSFDVRPGETIGIVGPVGAGKSTLLRAIARQVEIDRGQIELDGVDLVDVPLGALRAHVGMAPQDAFLFSEALIDNVRFGAPTAGRDEVEAAVRVANLEDDLARLPRGLDTMIGERGVNLSGGQRQRTSIARVALLRPRILLLDDTLSAVDPPTADTILERLRPIMEGRTTLVVAHRLRTVQRADRILVLEDGRLTAIGTHEELMARSPFYASVWAKQSEREELSRELGLDGGQS
ncbi:MAG: ABC transporter ATP-binding protein, partial [Planctomycetes bacterium]|nr:ABC transporter ATP-binding protein [Planctomycetota bacterium]